MLDLKKLASFYLSHNTGTQLNGKPALFFKPTKDEPRTYFLPLVDQADDIITIPMHNFVSLADGGHRSFICKKFLQALDPKVECPLCNDGLKAYKKYYFTALLYTGENIKKLQPAKDDEDFYKIGILDLSKALTTSLDTIQSMSGSYMSQVIALSRVEADGKVVYDLQKAKDLDCKEIDGKSLPDLDYQKVADSVAKYAGLNDYVTEETKESVYQLYLDSQEAKK